MRIHCVSQSSADAVSYSQRVGCDGRLGSDATEDTCGVCGGGGTSCKLMTGTFEQRLLKKRELAALLTLSRPLRW